MLLTCNMLIGCDDKPQDIGEYKSWFTDIRNGYVKEIVIKDLTYSVQYRPRELMMLNDIIGQDLSVNVIDSIRETYGNSEYFLLEIGPGQKLGDATGDLIKNYSYDYESYASIFNELAFHADENVLMIVGTDTLAPTLHHYEQGFELGTSQKILFAFHPAITSDNTDVVFIYDDEVFGAGRLRFKFNIDRSEIPQLPI